MDISKRDAAEIIKRLDILISLMLEPATISNSFKITGEISKIKDKEIITASLIKPNLKITDKISKLKELGVTASDTAGIIGKSSNYVTAALSQRKKRKNKGVVKDE